MKPSLIVALLGLMAACGVAGESTVYNIRLDVPYCNNCGMSDLGQISVKVS